MGSYCHRQFSSDWQFWMVTDCDPAHSYKNGTYWSDHLLMQLHLSVVTTSIRAVTIYQYVAILQYNIVQYNSIHLLRHIDILHRAIYCSVLRILCGLELDHWNVNIDKPSFSVWKPKAIKLLVVLRLAEHVLGLPFTGLIITTSVPYST